MKKTKADAGVSLMSVDTMPGELADSMVSPESGRTLFFFNRHSLVVQRCLCVYEEREREKKKEVAVNLGRSTLFV